MECLIQLFDLGCFGNILIHLDRFIESDFGVILLPVLLFTQIEYFSWTKHIVLHFYCNIRFGDPILEKVT